MNRRSIRVRLTLWYLAVLAPATLVLAAGSWWLARRSVTDSLDRTLAAQIDGAREFLTGMAREGLSHAEVKEEFGEFAELSRGQTLLDVTDAAGVTYSRPSMPGWGTFDDPRSGTSASATPADAAIHGEPLRIAHANVQAGGIEYRIVVALSERAGHDALRRFAWILAGLVPAVLVIAGLGGYWIAGRALAPVDRMTRTVQETTLRNLDRRLDVPPAQDELRRLAVTFNDMLERMQAGVADLTRLTAEASHELRTPVSLVRTTAEIALSQPRTMDEYRDALRDVLGHAERMSALVGDLLMLARADAGVEIAEATRVDLAELAREVVAEFQAAADTRSLALEVRADQCVPVLGDLGSLRRLLVILLENAVAYTPAGGRIALTVAEVADPSGLSAHVDVVDTGIGIEPAERPRVFDRFYRAAAARERVADGSGLGLSIAKTIVTRSHGSISLDAGPNGRGSHVRVRFPVMASEPDAPATFIESEPARRKGPETLASEPPISARR